LYPIARLAKGEVLDGNSAAAVVLDDLVLDILGAAAFDRSAIDSSPFSNL
jgi:hypothetical protein